MKVVDMRILRCMCGCTRKGKIINEVIRDKVRAVSVKAKMRETKLRWFSHVMRRGTDAPVRRCEKLTRNSFKWDINGDALHASAGLPPALNVSTAKVGKLEIILPSVSNVQLEPIVVQIDRLDLVLEERDDIDTPRSSSSATSSGGSSKGSGYGFADKIADGMTLQVHTVNLLLETHGGARRRGGASWASPMASITIHNLLLYTTNENWEVVNLKEARDFSSGKEFIYVFKKLEWEHLSIDLLPHPDMFADAHFGSFQGGSNKRDEDGAKRVFFGGERFIEGISGEAHITIQRTELNSPLGLEVQLHITEAVCPALRLRALLRFMTGLYVCINRGDVNPNLQRSTEAAGRSLVSIVVDHIFLRLKDTEFQLELLMQSLFFSRASISGGETAKCLTRLMIGGAFLRQVSLILDTFSRPPCTLLQPSELSDSDDVLNIPDFGKDFCPPIYPLGDQQGNLSAGVPLISLHSLQLKPSPTPPILASTTVINSQPLMIHLQEESCLRICSFLADGIVVNPGVVLSDFSINSLTFYLKGLDITVPLDTGTQNHTVPGGNNACHNLFGGARFHIEDFILSESPTLKMGLLNLEKDPACFCLWEDQPIDGSQKKWTAGASVISLSLQTSSDATGLQNSVALSSNLFRCVELKGACLEVAMATADGSPLTDVPPPGGIVRMGVACQQYLSNTSVEQLFFVLDFYTYFGRVSEKIAVAGRFNSQAEVSHKSLSRSLSKKIPGDTAVCLAVNDLNLRFLESSATDISGMPLVQFIGKGLSIKVTHRTLGGAIAISSSLLWEGVEVDCADTLSSLPCENSLPWTSNQNGQLVENGRQLRSVFWVQNRKIFQSNGNFVSVPFLDIKMVQVIPYKTQDMECHSLNVSACIAGVRLGGGMNYTETLLHRFGILGPDGGPGEGLTKGLEHLSAGPLSKLLKATPLTLDEQKDDGKDPGGLQLETPDDVDLSIELKDWLFALEGAQEEAERWWFCDHEDSVTEERCWHTTFQNICVKASSSKNVTNGSGKLSGKKRYPIELITVGMEGLQIIKPRSPHSIRRDSPEGPLKETAERFGGMNVEVDIVNCEDDVDDGMGKWIVENLKFSVKQPIEAAVTKTELQYLAFLCKSEVDSMGRISAGILRVLKLESKIGAGAISQLSNLGSEGFDRIFTPEKLSRDSSPPSNFTGGSRNSCLESTVASLEEMIKDSQTRCSALSVELASSTSSLDDVKELSQKLENMQKLLMRLRTLV
ncbi:putative autophagy-related protein 18f-like [Capsicum annuum]|uniref:Chorein N-terminal domain-containing protein n=1 Tax=Capsicum annuum TaxID=4072 RepID=A0A2G2Z5E7_CAPAN|nr:putative autophagy-related protein 18f-like [Capsicum annuum]KAF3658784.1 putative autophagy-related protein 18f-like [Capsicum annuum]PHT77232.1 hypothetical protein T459_20754 [Capsicum annuum]